MRGIELKRLRYFVVVARELHFGRAATLIGIDHAQLSREIRSLELGIGVRLLLRTTRSTRLTPAGSVFLEDAERVLALVESMRQDAKVAASAIEFRS